MQANLKGITHPCPYCEKDGRTPTVEQFMKHRQQHNPMSNSTQNKCPFCKSELISLVLPSNPPQYKTYCPNCENSKVSNSTQNDEIEVDGETYTKWDTQNDEIGKMEKAIDEGFAESERDLKDKKTPLDQPTQNDWEKVKTFGDFIDELFCKQNNPYEPIKDASPYHRYRNLCALVNNEIHEKMKGDRFYEENKHELWRVVENTVAATLYIQSQIKDKSSELADARREEIERMIERLRKPIQWIVGDDTGASSKVIWSVIMGVEPTWESVPYDEADYGRCVRLLRFIPEWQSRLNEVVDRYPNWKEAIKHILATLREEEKYKESVNKMKKQFNVKD